MSDQGIEKKDDPTRIVQGRSPAYPYIPLGRAIERIDQIRAAGAARTAMPPETFYKIWELGSQSSGARQTMAALNHFGLVEYIGRGEDRKVKLSDLALRIVLDKQPISPERSAAIKEAATNPPIHKELFGRFGSLLPADVVLETYLTRDRGFNEGAAQTLVGEYKDTLAYAELDKPDNMPEIEPVIDVEEPHVMTPTAQRTVAPVISMGPVLENLAENDIKVMLDGERIRVSAVVDIKGARRLLKALKANMALLEDDDEEAAH